MQGLVRVSRVLISLVVLVVLVALTAPSVHAAAPSFVKVIDESTLGNTVKLGAWSGKRPSLADVDGDGDLDLIAQNENRRVYVIDIASGRALAEVAPRYPYPPDLGPFNGPKAVDLDGDGTVELVNVNRAAMLSVWALTRGKGGIEPRLLWERHLNASYAWATADGGPALGDLDGDGAIDIVVQTEERGTYAFRHDGTALWNTSSYGGNAEPLIVDADGDGDLDAVMFTDGGAAYALEGRTGALLWRFESRHHKVWPGSVVSRGLVADLDGDGRNETVYCARNLENATAEYAPGAPWYRDHHFALIVAREGEPVWIRKPSWGNPLCSAYLIAHDIDGDGRMEIFGMDWNTIGHKPGNWERLGPANAFAFDSHGRELWHVQLNAFNAKAAIALADATGDGKLDVIAYDEGGIVILDARDGRRLHRVDLGRWTVGQGPLIADVDGDERDELIVAVTGKSHAFLVYRLPATSTAPGWPGWEWPDPARAPPPAPQSPAPQSPAPQSPAPQSPAPQSPAPPPPPPEENRTEEPLNEVAPPATSPAANAQARDTPRRPIAGPPPAGVLAALVGAAMLSKRFSSRPE